MKNNLIDHKLPALEITVHMSRVPITRKDTRKEERNQEAPRNNFLKFQLGNIRMMAEGIGGEEKLAQL